MKTTGARLKNSSALIAWVASTAFAVVAAAPLAQADTPAAPGYATPPSSASASGAPQTSPMPSGTPNSSASAVSPTEQPFKPGPALSYTGWYFGPSVTAPGSPYQPTTQGLDDPTNAAVLLNYVSAGYHLTKELTLYGVAWWYWNPYRGGDYTWNDPYLKLVDSNVYTNGGFSIKGDVRIYVPATQQSQQNGLLAGFRTTPKFDYTPPGSRWTFELTGYLWAYMYGQYASAPNGGTPQDLQIYVAPNIAYQITPTLAGTLLYELYGHHDVEGEPPFVNTNDPTDVELGVSWDITPWLNFSPYVQAYPGSFSWSSTSYAGILSATFL